MKMHVALGYLCFYFVTFACAQSVPHSSPEKQALDQGKALVDQGRLAEADVVLEQAHDLAPMNTELLILSGKVKSRMGEFPAAITLFQRVIQMNPKSAGAHVDLAIAFSDAGELSNALEETSEALTISPNLAAAHLNRARILSDLKRAEEARREFATVCQLAPEDPDSFFYWSLLERDSGHLAKETALLQRVVKLQPRNDKAFFMLGRSLLDQSRKDEAVAALRSALTINPNSSAAIYMLSRALQRTEPEVSARLRGQFDAVRRKDAILEESKTIGDKGYLASANKNWPEAIELFRQALARCGDCEIEAALHKNLGLTLCRNGNIEEGRNELQRALELNPNDPDVLKALVVLRQ